MESKKEVKQCILMRVDLNMRKGKMIAQGAHASLGVITNKMTRNENKFIIRHPDDFRSMVLSYIKDDPFDLWLNGTFTKICLKVSSEEELVSLYNKAVEEGIPSCLITDSGKTEFNGVSTKTCCAIGPHWSEEIDKVTGHLSLL
jgi:PTH2 family peptidyl-tRNA hydrolase